MGQSLPEQCPGDSAESRRWHTFEDILRRLHQEGLYLHPHQLATFFVWHGLPVDLQYVPPCLQQRAAQINDNYLGDMARLEAFDEPPWYSSSLDESFSVPLHHE
ncbi:hypothetical protein OsccyDRAFT_2628 [Leptolyngbyaceae cyanobacterium JSC-12]|nr:hypothetical protein OsccyDRAFT_2628 [Leptolyngbyaceae cyanobacterium JSC-12]